MTVTIAPGFKEGHRADVARLFLEAFGAKLAPALGTDTRAVTFIARGLRPDFAFSATLDGRLVGVAGIKTAKGGLMTASYADLRASYGAFGAVWRGAVLDLFERKLDEGVLQMDGIFVAEAARGQGVGSKLLDAVVWTARMNRCDTVRLDVVDTNTRARALYERYGFQEVGRMKSGLLAPLMGFREATTMALPLS
ncbi:MAG: GNAT family N-acetyltransferase [Pseudomonadota bacterium]